MAGKLNPEEVKTVLERLSGVNRSLGSSIELLDECQKKLHKAIKCQGYLNHCLKPIQTGFALKKNEKSVSDATAT